MFDFDTNDTKRRGRKSAFDWQDPPPPARLPFGLIAAAALGALVIGLLVCDEANQFDPVLARADLDRKLVRLRAAAEDTRARREQLLQLRSAAAANPAVIKTARIAPEWKLEPRHETPEEFRRAVGVRLAHADQKLRNLAAAEEATLAEIAALPPPEARRVSLLRRALRMSLGELKPPYQDEGVTP